MIKPHKKKLHVKLLSIIALNVFYLVTPGCKSLLFSEIKPSSKINNILVDSFATSETLNLYLNLKNFTRDKTLFGHQETTAYGVGWTYDGVNIESDVKKISGDFPAVYGWDIGNIGKRTNNDCIPFEVMKKLIIDAYERGGINTISSHMYNPYTGNNYNDVKPTLPHILPGGTHHQKFIEKLDLIADFLKDLKTEDGIPIPIIFRPFHEHNGDWFWWGRGPAAEKDFVKLWKFTVDYFINEKEIHNLLFAFSPDRSRMVYPLSTSDYLYGYPGDNYVDIFGFDNYFDLDGIWNKAPIDQQKKSFKESLELIVDLAEEKNKIAALTETGSVNLRTKNWWTKLLLDGIETNNKTKKIAYLLVWRNEDFNHFHVPYLGHNDASDFLEFYKNPTIIFNSDLPDLYNEKVK
ncbi:MAG: beta-mannosidase [Ignavibacteriales bacterium]|nr:beta-mannosidase [Ignavibacteriales bacterium]MCB9219667.1 beta-mannosidase [Ignavibacteriales bacterium]